MPESYCSECGTLLADRARFCSACGRGIDVDLYPPSSPPAPLATSPRITEEDARRIARAQTNEFGRNFGRGCGWVIAFIVIATIIITVYVSWR